VFRNLFIARLQWISTGGDSVAFCVHLAPYSQALNREVNLQWSLMWNGRHSEKQHRWDCLNVSWIFVTKQVLIQCIHTCSFSWRKTEQTKKTYSWWFFDANHRANRTNHGQKQRMLKFRQILSFKLVKISEPNSIRWWCSGLCCESWGLNFASKL